MKSGIDIVVEHRKWRESRGLARRLERAALLALRRGGCRRRHVGLAILLGSDMKLRNLNLRFRNKNAATNVLSFASPGDSQMHLGDVALAYGVSAKEARALGRSLADHASHLAVHGVLHLLGFDHETSRDARKMQAIEISVLAELGIADPYATRSNAA